jgi:hypothetical protein
MQSSVFIHSVYSINHSRRPSWITSGARPSRREPAADVPYPPPPSSPRITRTKVLLLEVQRRQTGFLTSLTIIQVVIIQAQHRRRLRDERVAVRVPTLGGRRLATEQRRHATHERRLAASGIRGETDDDGTISRGARDDAGAGRATRVRRLLGDDGRGAGGGGESELRGHAVCVRAREVTRVRVRVRSKKKFSNVYVRLTSTRCDGRVERGRANDRSIGRSALSIRSRASSG